jgi:hypothetical protein
MMIEIEDDTFCGLMVAKLKEDLVDSHRNLQWHTEHGHQEDADFYKMLIPSIEGVLQYYMVQTDAIAFANETRSLYENRT